MSNWLGGGTVNSTVANYSVTWYFLGNEAANQDQLSLNSGTFNFSTTSGSLGAGNHNSNLGPSTAYDSLISIGSTTGSGANAPISFSLSDISAGGRTTSDISGQTGFADIYVNPMCGVSVCGSSLALLSGWEVSTTATNWFAIGYNDTGSSDKDYDDLVFVGEITATPRPAHYRCLPAASASWVSLGNVTGGRTPLQSQPSSQSTCRDFGETAARRSFLFLPCP